MLLLVTPSASASWESVIPERPSTDASAAASAATVRRVRSPRSRLPSTSAPPGPSHPDLTIRTYDRITIAMADRYEAEVQAVVLREKVHFPSGDTTCAASHYPGTNGGCVIMAGGFAVTKE